MKFKPLPWLQLKHIQLLLSVLRALWEDGLAKVAATAASFLADGQAMSKCRHLTHIKVHFNIFEFLYLRALISNAFLIGGCA